MKTSNDILDAVAKKLGGVNDHTIARETGLTPAAISLVRTGRRSISPRDCKKVAAVLGCEVGALVAIATAEREDDRAIRESLLKLAEGSLKIAAQTGKARRKVAAAALLAVGLQVAPTPPVQAVQAVQQQPAACLLCKVAPPRRIRRRERRGVAYPKRIKPTVYRGLAGIPEIKPRFLLRSLSDTVSLHRDVA
jgi:transcriptional regulator with XRE-family HTH domain